MQGHIVCNSLNSLPGQSDPEMGEALNPDSGSILTDWKSHAGLTVNKQ